MKSANCMLSSSILLLLVSSIAAESGPGPAYWKCKDPSNYANLYCSNSDGSAHYFAEDLSKNGIFDDSGGTFFDCNPGYNPYCCRGKQGTPVKHLDRDCQGAVDHGPF
ncbi:hypothetical protein PGT21_018730 [Puccinia graminis f. sp. tritici]|uniref:Uncharacterized protein n=1 Tax=Puccinia graminis f. sp. tritici TaxID=56615 RepID=A0A5B0NVD5_PUCGR|nr:hypothetical protein PGT21_018730 [Puccinia graminis f. sp. tritici]KAA1115726.1 hypothetical protein PGTUg99_028834 [Puccinia graminis f. sp. tritici]